MKLVDRYIAKTVLASIALVTLMLAGLQLFILFVGQLGDIGKADYGIVQALQYVCLQMPYQVYLFFPMASLLGCLIGLGVMANHHELVVMRAAGMSIGQMIGAVLKAAMIVIILVTVIGEMLVPRLVHYANEQKAQALSDGQTLQTSKGMWLRYHNDFINIGMIMPDNELSHVYQFHFDKRHHLRLTRKIDRVTYENNVWKASGIAETVIEDKQTKARFIKEMTWDVVLDPKTLGIGNHESDEMTLSELQRYLHAPGVSRQVVRTFQLAFLQRLIQPVTTMVMMVLAIPFIFGPLRSSTMGSKLLTGAIVGFGFHMINHFFGPLTQVFQWPPAVAAFGPTIVFALLGLYLMRRVR